jgi:hypothetical protein
MGSAANSVAAGGDVLFELPIEDTGGKIVVTRPAEKVYLVTFSSGADNRLTTVRV